MDNTPVTDVKSTAPYNLVDYVSYMCYELTTPFKVKFKCNTQEEYQSVEEKLKKSKRTLPSRKDTRQEAAIDEEQTITAPMSTVNSGDALEIVVDVVTDNAGHPIHLIFNRCVMIPRLLIKMIAAVLPYQNHLQRFTVRWGPLTGVVLYEFAKFLNYPQITEICLDDSPVAERNYEVLLNRPSCLAYLSLARCNLDDDDCAKLAALLALSQPAAGTLRVLLLGSNRIGDIGAHALANTLRTNRGLHYLDLAGNQITDSGAIRIFSSLMEFALMSNEIMEKRLRLLEYSKKRVEVYNGCIRDLRMEKSHEELRSTAHKKKTSRTQSVPITLHRMEKSHEELRSASHKKKTTSRTQSDPIRLCIDNAIQEKAEAMTSVLVGKFIDPFSEDQLTRRDGLLCCIGNTSLCALNLSYNNLGHPSLTSLQEVLTYQSWLGVRAAPGLLRVSIDGNNLPMDCDELFFVSDLLDSALTAKIPVKPGTDKSKPNRQSLNRPKIKKY